MRRLFCVLLIFGLVVGAAGEAHAILSYFPLAWNGAGAFFDANNALWTAVKAGVSGCGYYCASAWTAATLATAAAARIGATGLYYGSIVGLSGVSVYMLYKGFEYVNGVWRGPNSGGTYYAVPGAPGVGSMQVNNRTFQVYPTEAAAKAAYNACGGHGYGKTSDWDWSYWNTAYGECAYYTGCCSPGPFCCHVYPLNGHTEYVALGTEPKTVDATTTTIGADLAGTNGSEAQIKAMAALTAATVALTDAYNKWKEGTAPAALPAPYNQIPAAGWQVIADQLASGISQTAKDDLAAQDVPENAFKDIINPPAVPAVTPTDMAAAVEAGVKAADDDLAVPSDISLGDPGSVEAPTKDAIAGKLDTYWSAINNIPVLNLLTSLSLNSTGAGSPTIQVAVPSIFASEGTTYTISFDESSLFGINYGNYLALLGNLMLAFAGIVWTKYLFEG